MRKPRKSWGLTDTGNRGIRMKQTYIQKLLTKYNGLRLNVKFMLLIILFIEVVVGIFSVILFWSMRRSTIQEKITEIVYEMDRQHAQIRKNVDAINMSTQFFLNDLALQDFLVELKRGDSMPADKLNAFYHENIASMERMVNSNFYLYQIRVYADQDTMQEMMPILYTRERMNRLEWAQDEPLFGWKFNYLDAIFDSYTVAQNNRILSLVTPIEDYENGELAVLEVSMTMDTMFEGLYNAKDDMVVCFLDETGQQYYGSEEDRENPYIQAVLEKIHTVEEDQFHCRTVNGKEIIAGCIKVKELSGNLVCVQDISGAVGQIRRIRNWFILVMILFIPFLAAGINVVVKTVLHQFYRIIDAIKRVQTGDLGVVIEDCGTDEMGELGSQVNKMLTEINHLMKEQIDKELLVKNSEIKALQNQINAHFIYNVLESIKMMAEIEEQYDISDAVTTLGKLLRYSMRWTTGNVTVAEEIEYIKNYLKLINIRFDYEIFLSLNIPDIIYAQRIPKMSLQPIVENAIYHGIEQMAEDTNIYIKGLMEGDSCVIEITDAGRGMSEEQVEQLYKKISGEIETAGGSGNGIGLKNVQDRIRMNFGEQYGIEIASKLGCYTKIMVRIPLQPQGGGDFG